MLQQLQGSVASRCAEVCYHQRELRSLDPCFHAAETVVPRRRLSRKQNTKEIYMFTESIEWVCQMDKLGEDERNRSGMNGTVA